MNKIIIASLLLCTSLSTVQAQTKSVVVQEAASEKSIASVFLRIPQTLLHVVDVDRRARLVATPQDTATVAVENLFGDKVKRLAISPDYLSLQTSAVSTLQIKLLSLVNNSKIICVVKTVTSGFSDSEVLFFTDEWIPIQQSDMLPKLTADWFVREDVDTQTQSFKNAYASVDLQPFKVILSPDEPKMSIHFEIKNHLSEADYKVLKPFLKDDAKILVWDKSKFK